MIIDEYASVISQYSEVSYPYAFYTMLTLVGNIIGRQRYILNPTPLYPNYYLVLVGNAGIARKTTAIKIAYQEYEKLFYDPTDPSQKPPIAISWGIASAEGLMKELMHTPNRIIISNEFIDLLKKARTEGGGRIISVLNNLYDCPPVVENTTVKEPTRVENPFVSILSSSTMGWMQDVVRREDLQSGFMSRFIIVYEPKETIQNPIAFPHLKAEEYKEELNKLLPYLNRIRINLMGDAKPIELSDEAVREYEDYYKSLYEQDMTVEYALAIKRLDLFAKKLMVVFYALNRDKPVTSEQMRQIIDYTEQVKDYHLNFYSHLTLKVSARNERVILDIIRKHKYISIDRLAEKVYPDISYAEMKYILSVFAELGKIYYKKNGHGVMIGYKGAVK